MCSHWSAVHAPRRKEGGREEHESRTVEKEIVGSRWESAGMGERQEKAIGVNMIRMHRKRCKNINAYV